MKTDKVGLNVQIDNTTDRKIRMYASIQGISLGDALKAMIDQCLTPEQIDEHLAKVREDLLA